MPARIIETNPVPFNTVAIDPVTLDIIENALRNARIEMDATLVRTAMSPGIREQGDAFPLISDPAGKMIVGQFGSFIDGFLKQFDGTIEDGDMIFLSDPYSCGGAVSHSNDWLVLLPVFKDGRAMQQRLQERRVRLLRAVSAFASPTATARRQAKTCSSSAISGGTAKPRARSSKAG